MFLRWKKDQNTDETRGFCYVFSVLARWHESGPDFGVICLPVPNVAGRRCVCVKWPSIESTQCLGMSLWWKIEGHFNAMFCSGSNLLCNLLWTHFILNLRLNHSNRMERNNFRVLKREWISSVPLVAQKGIKKKWFPNDCSSCEPRVPSGLFSWVFSGFGFMSKKRFVVNIIVGDFHIFL